MGGRIKVWDPFVRFFHWTLVAAFAVAFVTEDDAQALHVLAGYTVITLVVTRIAWGFIGTAHARFSDFVRGPRAVIQYLKAMLRGRPPHFLGHNPAGGAMVIALLVMLLATTLSGLAAYGLEGEGPLGGMLWRFEPSAEHTLEEMHELFANSVLLLVGLHVVGVVAGSFLHGENLVRAMFTGRKSVD